MKQPKSFDCVRMKWDIQKKLEEESAGMPEQQARRVQQQRVDANPILGPFLKQVRVLALLSGKTRRG